MRVRDSYRRNARRLWLACLQDGRPRPEAVRAVVAALQAHPQRGGAAILSAFVERLRRYDRQHQARVVSAVPMDDAARAAAAGLLKGRAGGVDEVDFAVDAALIGGLRAYVGYTLIDGSVQGRLQRLRQALQED